MQRDRGEQFSILSLSRIAGIMDFTMNWLAATGEKSLNRVRAVFHLAALVWAVLRIAFSPGRWTRPLRDVLGRQILFTAVEAVPFMTLVACMTGIAIVLQVQIWLTNMGHSQLLGPMLAAVVIREAAPLIANFVVIGRSGSAVATELGNMKVNGEVDLLDAQGLDPFLYLVVPRVLSLALSVFCLAFVFIIVSLGSGFLCGILVGANLGSPAAFAECVLGAVEKEDILNLLAKTICPGLLTGAICCSEGFSVRSAVTEVPQATTRALVRSVGAFFVIAAIVSLITYF